ncbi:FtsB family cell division protein [Tsukamurella strandjordii]|uniref:Septum formation initiator family protein n=1 Tax=Tsukamurella strandjordii TaxID=147577 RepID=A0AA90NK22_9ACTN|nr:septum formation initiator family protein [Tsukamurella strandjordii]MDP0400453.1 septum formation initiator family protein [Tsukamurella strandjordii]
MSRTRVVTARNSPGGGDRPESGSAGRVVVLFVVLCVLVLTLAVPVRTYLSEQAREDKVAAEHSQLLADIARLEEQKRLQDDPAYIKQQARIRLQYVMPGETAYRVQFPGAPAPTPEQIEAEQSKQNPWYTNVWRTIAVPH